jgi:hypothetical protein
VVAAASGMIMFRGLHIIAAAIAAGFLPVFATPLAAEQVSEGRPHKWEAVPDKSMYDFVAEGFELKSVAYDTSVLGPETDAPDVHYFLRKGRPGQV